MVRPAGPGEVAGDRFTPGKDFFKNIFDEVQTGLLIIDPVTHTILDANASATDLIGTEKEKVIGSICHKFICPADKGRCPITDLHQTVDRSDRILLTTDGRKVPIIKSVGFITIGDRKYLLENFIDNSERRKAEEALRIAEHKTRAIFDQTFQFIGLLTPDGILTDANRSALKFSGITESDVIGKPFWDTPWWTHSPELRQKLREAVAAAAGGSFVRFEATHLSRDGSLRFIDFSLKPVTGAGGEVLYLIPEGRDITDRKNVEDELKKKNEDLYAAYEQLTATEEELRQNYHELEKKEHLLLENERRLTASLAEKEVLLRELHHRVMNNLQMIISLLNLQSRQIRDEETLGAIRKCQNRVRAMAFVHEKTYLSDNLSDIDITDYIRFLARYLFDVYSVDSRRITLKADGESVRAGINTAIPLGLVVNEILTNSILHAFPDGRPGEIVITITRTPEHIVIVVRDNGIGIPEEYDWKKSDTLGVALIKNLSRQVPASLEVTRSSGTGYRLTIPLASTEPGRS